MTVELYHWEVDGDLEEADSVFLSVQLVSELDGVEELLHCGWLTVDAIAGEHRFAVDNDWLRGTALLALDVVDEFDAPKLSNSLAGWPSRRVPSRGSSLAAMHCFRRSKDTLKPPALLTLGSLSRFRGRRSS